MILSDIVVSGNTITLTIYTIYNLAMRVFRIAHLSALNLRVLALSSALRRLKSCTFGLNRETSPNAFLKLTRDVRKSH
jgi:hypothetical protein